jgi:gentisate 1,2-dioxygenase
MAKGDLITTPNWSWHDHVSEGKQDTVWLDGAVAPLIVNFNVGFSEPHQEPRQAVSAKGNWSRMQFGPLQPRNPKYSTTSRRPPYRYPWEQTRRVLDQLAAEEGDRFDDVVLHFSDPLTGGPTLMTVDCEMQLLRPHWSGRTHRHTHATIYHVVEGEGVSQVGDKRLEWGPGDTFVVPIWATHRHENTGANAAVLFSISDRPVMTALGFDREDDSIRQ